MPFVGANIGGAVWKRFTMTLDYDNLTMTLTPNASFDAPDSWDRSGLFLVHTGSSIVIIDARPGTPAAKAGLVKGDAIDSIDGTPVASLTLKAVREALSAAPGTVVHLVVRTKSGATSTVNITLADYV
jgi:C-terminal processing protease CtpA/Prc